MTTTVPQYVPRHAAPQSEVIAATLARRARELARDPGVTIVEGAHHLVRLAKGRRSPLEGALTHLRPGVVAGSELEHARILLRRALEEAGSPSRLGGDGSGAEALLQVLDARVD